MTTTLAGNSLSINREDVAMKVMDALEPTIATQEVRAIESQVNTRLDMNENTIAMSSSRADSVPCWES